MAARYHSIPKFSIAMAGGFEDTGIIIELRVLGGDMPCRLFQCCNTTANNSFHHHATHPDPH
jgi:hypothetical protein